jgi:hypothetical protein
MQDLIQAQELLQEDFPAKTSALLAKGLVLLAKEAGYSGTLQELWTKRKANTSSSKTSLVCYPVTKEEILESSSERWPTSGILLGGACLMLNTLEYPSAGAVSSSLADVLLEKALPKYFLSPTACEGIIRRANRRGKTLPPALQEALVKQVSQSTPKE